MKLLLALMSVTLLSACGEDRPPAPTAEEAARLDETEAMLNDVESLETVTQEPAEDRR